MKTGAHYVDVREAHPAFVLLCEDAQSDRVQTRHLWRTSAFGQIEESGILKPGVEQHLRELDPKRKADRLLLEAAARAEQSGIERSHVAYEMMKGVIG